MRIFSLAIYLLIFAVIDAEAACSSYQYQCVTTSECVYEIDLCDGRSNCADGSDEAREFCNLYYPLTCNRGYVFNCGTNKGCEEWIDMCRYDRCASQINATLCNALNSWKIPDFRVKTPVEATPRLTVEDLSSFISLVNKSVSSDKCPPFYNNVSNSCYAFLPFELSWAESLEICESISGRLAEFHDILTFYKFIRHIQRKGLTSNFWIGGFYDITVEGWRWESGNMMALGTPFWTIRYEEKCSPRLISEALGETKECFHNHQAPTVSSAGQCASLDFKDMFFMNNQPCTYFRKPLCIYGH